MLRPATGESGTGTPKERAEPSCTSFSRAIYRELAPRSSRTSPGSARAHEPRARAARVRGRDRAPRHRPPLLRAPGADAVQRHPDLLPDVRPGPRVPRRRPLPRARRRVPRAPADDGLRRSTGNPLAVPRDDAQGHACQRMPLPHNGYCPSHQHLAETEELRSCARGRIARGRAIALPSACCSGSTSAARSPTPCCVGDGGLVHGEGADDAGGPVARACWPPSSPRSSAPARAPGEVERVRARHDRRDERAARGQGARARRWSPPRASPTSSSSAARRAPTCTGCAPPRPRRSCPPELRFGAPERMTPDGAAARARATTARAALVAARRRRRARGGRRRAAARLPPPRARAARSASARASAARTCTSRSRTRSSARSASTSAPPRPRSTPRSRRCSAATCAGSPSARARARACPSRRSCSPPAGSTDLAQRRRRTPR